MLTTETKSKGEFSFEQVLPGSYRVKVTSAGFSEDDEKIDLLVSTPMKLVFQTDGGHKRRGQRGNEPG